MNKTLFYISTNDMWSGSEELWFQSSILFAEENWNVFYSCKYNYDKIDNIIINRLPFFQNLEPERLVNKIFRLLRLNNLNNPQKKLIDQLKNIKPQLVVISQGNNVSCIEIAECCKEANISYVIITQLVAEIHFLAINDNSLNRLRSAFKNSLKNYFVSQQNLDLNNFMLGLILDNTELIYNPGKKNSRKIIPYPTTNTYNIALVGRLECYHKGYDLLFNALKKQEWSTRNIKFNFYGNGPHLQLLKSNASIYGFENINFKGNYKDLEDVWRNNHILLMPSRIEGQPLALIEAMYNGRSVIATKVGGITELIEDCDNGYLCQVDVEQIASVLEKAWNDRNKWQEMGEKAFQSIKEKHPINEISFFNEKLKLILIN